ncbi:hypothetical protein [Companilactobacillus futsaii]|uniref:hypothetical protein n=1 Tax=Companilactobacillus futsaii TaxID=938155 RepID=UPI00189E7606|nr:hypothetical protein [Companilactobacillus futsaii]
MTTALLKFLLFLTIITAPLAYHSTVQNASADTTDLQTYRQDSPPFTPSPPGKSGTFISRRGGFISPQQELYSGTIGTPLTIRLNIIRPAGFSKWMVTDTYTWWESSDKKKWNIMKGSKDSKLTIDNSHIGIKYYQLKVHYHKKYVSIFGSKDITIYSKIIKVITNENPIDTERLDIDTNSNYLLNTNSTLVDNVVFASVTREPIDSTDNITWTTDDNSLAKIDSNGKVTAATLNNFGDVTIIASVTNSINKQKIKAEKSIHVGGGLEDMSAKLGEDVTFKVQGLSDDKRDSKENLSVEWYQKSSPTSSYIKLPNSNQTELTLKNVTSKLDGSSYYAKFKYDKESFKTNPAQLTISNSIIGIDNQIQNTSNKDDPLDTKTNLANVSKDDKLTYTLHLSNANKTNLKDQTLVIPLPLQVDITDLKINDDPHIEYKLQTESLKKKNLILDLAKFKDNEDLNIELNLKVGKISNNFEFKSTPVISGTYLDDDNDNRYHNNGSTISLHFITNMFFPTIHDITFSPIQTYIPNSLIYRLNDTNAPNNIIDFDDQRRKYNPVQIQVAQDSAFYDKDKNILPATLQLHDLSNDTFTDISEHPTLITASAQDQQLHYLNWTKNEGLLLRLKPGSFRPGDYKTTLNWTFIEST